MDTNSLLEKTNKKNYIKYVEDKISSNRSSSFNKEDLKVGNIVKLGYIIPEGGKDRTQYYEGLIICKKNRGLNKTFTLRRSVQGIGVEQIFLENSPKIVSVIKKQSSKIRRAKLYFIRKLRGKATRLKKVS